MNVLSSPLFSEAWPPPHMYGLFNAKISLEMGNRSLQERGDFLFEAITQKTLVELSGDGKKHRYLDRNNSVDIGGGWGRLVPRTTTFCSHHGR